MKRVTGKQTNAAVVVPKPKVGNYLAPVRGMVVKILLTSWLMAAGLWAQAQEPASGSADTARTPPVASPLLPGTSDSLQTTAATPDSTRGSAPSDTVKPELRPSPVALALYKDESTYIKIVYGQPFKKGRVIFGNLAKWGQVWRTGANEATEITFTRDVKFDGRICRAGTYTLFTVPNPDKWTIILNSELGQWGAYSYKAEKDVLRFDVPAEKSDQVFEALTFKFNESDAGADLVLQWDEVKVNIPLAFSR